MNAELNSYVFSKFDKMVLTIPEPMKEVDRFYKPTLHHSTHDMCHCINDKSTDILQIIKKYVPTDCFDRSGYDIKLLYDHITINRPFINKMSNRVYFNIYVKPLLETIYNKAFSSHLDGDVRNEKCKLFINDIVNAIEADDKMPKRKKKPISATVKKLVWNTHIGEEIGKAKCVCCNVTDITQLSFNCGHIHAEANGGDTIVSNLKPICQNCNSSMGTKNMNDFMKTLK